MKLKKIEPLSTLCCDMCKKVIPSPVRETNYITVLDKNFCLVCYDAFMNSVRTEMLSKKTYSIAEYKKAVRKKIESV